MKWTVLFRGYMSYTLGVKVRHDFNDLKQLRLALI